MKVMVIPIVVGALGMVTKGLKRRLEEFEISKNQDHKDHSIVKIGENT